MVVGWLQDIHWRICTVILIPKIQIQDFKGGNADLVFQSHFNKIHADVIASVYSAAIKIQYDACRTSVISWFNVYLVWLCWWWIIQNESSSNIWYFCLKGIKRPHYLCNCVLLTTSLRDYYLNGPWWILPSGKLNRNANSISVIVKWGIIAAGMTIYG